MSKLVKIFFLGLLLIAPYNLAAWQVSTINFSPQYVASTWDNTNGLPQNTVFNITSDQTGYLWFTTEEGFVRFDGAQFKLFNETNIPELESIYFLDIEASKEGGIWAASRRDIVRVLNHEISSLQLGSLTNAQITDIAEAPDGRLWGGTNTGQLFVVENNSLKWVEGWESQNPESIIEIEASGEYIYIGTTNGLYKINPETNEVISMPSIQQKSIRSIFIIDDQNLWIGTHGHGAFHLSGDETIQYNTENGFLENFINDIVVSSDGEVWAASASSGVYKLEDSTFVPFDDFEVLNDDIRSIHTSSNGVTWLGTTGSGIIQLKPADIYTLPDRYTLSSSIVLPIYQHQDGEIWIGTAGKGLNRLAEDNDTHYSRNQGLSNEIVLSIYGTENYLYVGTPNGLNRFNFNTETFDKLYNTNDGLANNIVQVVYESDDDKIWVATREGGLHKIIDEKIHRVEVPDELRNAEFLSVYEDSEKNLWFGTNGMGALKVTPNESMEVFSTKDGLSDNIIYHFYEDKEASIWISTTNGLNVFTGDTLKSFNRSNGLSADEIYYIAEDENGFLWMSSNSGLQRINSQELLEAKNAAVSNFSFSSRLYNRNHGMPNSEANGGIFPAAWTMENGDIWFPTVNGVAIVKPNSLVNAEQPLNIHFESLRFAGEEVFGDEDVTIPAGVHYVEADYTSINFLNSNDITFSYRIKELDNKWADVGERRTLYLTLQNPGTYTLEIRAERDGITSETAVKSFTIQPFFYQTWGFKFFIFVFLFGLALLFNMIRIKSQISRKLQDQVDIKTQDLQSALNEKEVLLQEVHHRVKNNLAVISGLLQIQQFEIEDEEMFRILGSSVTRIKSMALIHEKLYQSNSLSNLEFKQYVEELVTAISKVDSAKNDVNINLDSEEVILNINQAVPCALILNELVSNALEHAFVGNEKNHKEIKIRLKETSSNMIISVKDNGIGIPKDIMSSDAHSMGLTIVQTLVRQLNAEMNIENTDGTQITISFKKNDISGAHSRLISTT